MSYINAPRTNPPKIVIPIQQTRERDLLFSFLPLATRFPAAAQAEEGHYSFPHCLFARTPVKTHSPVSGGNARLRGGKARPPGRLSVSPTS